MSNPTHTQVLTTAGSEPRKIRQPRMSFGKWARQLGWKHAVGLVVCLYAIFPILYITSTALSKGGTVTSGVLFSEFYFGNFTALFDPANQHDRPFTQWVINTIAIASINAFCSVFISALAAYAFSRMRFAGRRGGLMTLILVQMFPSILGLVAIYGILSEVTKYFPPLGLGSLGGLIMIYLGGSLGGGTYLMYGFFNTAQPTPRFTSALSCVWWHQCSRFRRCFPSSEPPATTFCLPSCSTSLSSTLWRLVCSSSLTSHTPRTGQCSVPVH
jgi:arabinogalactan oligomer/maltooligosaccharide transport system permease protein